jgi:hypothetical protein
VIKLARKFYADRMADVPIRKIADLIGHATIQMTTKYVHLSPSSKLDAVRKLDAFGRADKVTVLHPPTDARTDTIKSMESVNSSNSFVSKCLGR